MAINEQSEPESSVVESSLQDVASEKENDGLLSGREMNAKGRASQYRKNRLSSADFIIPDQHLKILFKNLKSFFQTIEGRDLDKTIIMEKTKEEFQKAER